MVVARLRNKRVRIDRCDYLGVIKVYTRDYGRYATSKVQFLIHNRLSLKKTNMSVNGCKGLGNKPLNNN